MIYVDCLLVFDAILHSRHHQVQCFELPEAPMPVPGTSKVPRYHEPVGCSGRWPLRCLPLRFLPLRCLPACHCAACHCAPCRCATCHCAGASERRGPWNGVQLRRRARLVEHNCALRTPRPPTRRKRPAHARPMTIGAAQTPSARAPP